MLRTLELILLFLIFSPVDSEKCLPVVEKEGSQDQEQIMRADTPTIVEFTHAIELHIPKEKQNKSLEKKIKGFGWLPGQNFSFQSTCVNKNLTGVYTHETALISESLLRHCYRSKSSPSPWHHA